MRLIFPRLSIASLLALVLTACSSTVDMNTLDREHYLLAHPENGDHLLLSGSTVYSVGETGNVVPILQESGADEIGLYYGGMQVQRNALFTSRKLGATRSDMDNDGNASDGLWKYTVSGGKRIFNNDPYNGAHFAYLPSPTKDLVAIVPNFGQLDNNGTEIKVINDLGVTLGSIDLGAFPPEVKNFVNETLLHSENTHVWVGLEQWSQDSTSFWLSIGSDGQTRFFAQYVIADQRLNVYPAPKNIEADFSLDPDSSRLLYSTWSSERTRADTLVELHLYNFLTRKDSLITKEKGLNFRTAFSDLGVFTYTNKDGLIVPVEDGKNSEAALREQGMIGVAMIEGQMMTIWKDDQVIPSGGAQRMLENFRLQNGINVMMDGTVVMPDGKTVQLHDGETMMMDGTIKQGASLPKPI